MVKRRPGQAVVVRGLLADDKFTLFFLDGERIGAVVTANRMGDLRAARRPMERDMAVCPDLLADESKPLQGLLGK